MDTDRNLLFGVLALHLDLIDSEQFARACTAWSARKDESLGEILVEQGFLTHGDRADVERLLQRKVQRHGGDVRASLAEAVGAGVAASLACVADAEVQRSLCALSRLDDALPVSTLDYVPERGHRYTRTRLHAKGGIGQVWLTHDAALGRNIALKELRPERAGHEAARARFLDEARITGQLEHPGIVPVYELEQGEDGQPFYTMRFVKGRTLSDAVKAYHERRRAGKVSSLDLRELLTAFLTVCQVVAYAHSRKVLHRDLKGPNVVLGSYGEVIVLDWGLAKVMGRADAAEVVGSLLPVDLSESGSHGETMEGQALGTMGYMAPEQAEGRLREIGKATDVYGLGAILYEILTGAPSFTGPDFGEFLRWLREEEPLPPSGVVVGTPRVLEAICRKAMAKKPAERYQSAADLARDVERWLADEPTSVYREGPGQRLGRWARRHKPLVASTAVLLAAAVVGLSAGTVLLDRANGQLAKQSQLADENFQAARQTVATYLTNVSENQLLKEPRLQPLRKELLTLALKYYEKFIDQSAHDPSVRKELADAHICAGNIYRETYTGPDEKVGTKRGKELQARGVALYEELVREKPGDRELRAGLAKSLAAMAVGCWVDGDHRAALDSSSRAIELGEQLRSEEPNKVEFSRALGESYSGRALIKRDTDDREGQAADIRRAVEIFQEMLRIAPDDEATLGSLATAYRRANRLDFLLEGVRIARQLGKSGKPNDGNALGNAAGVYAFDLGQPGKAEPLLRESVELWREEMRQSPESIGAILNFATFADNLGETLFLQGKTQSASRALKETISGMEELKRRNFSQGNGDNPAWFRYILGCVEYETGYLTGGLDRCQSAMRGEEELLDQNKARGEENPGFVANSLTIGEMIARFRFLAGRLSREGRLAQQHQILAERKALHQRQPKVGQFEREVGASAGVLAEVLLETGRADEALAVVEDVLPTLEKLVHIDKGDGSQPSQLDSRNYLIRRVWAELLARKGEALARTGKAADAGKTVRPAVEITEDLSKQEPCYLYDLARHLTLASSLPGSAGVSNPADRAIKALGDFVASGFDNPYKLRTDPRLEPLRKREEFQKLVRDLEIKVKETKEPK
jgi:serine/threonine-protein kinase